MDILDKLEKELNRSQSECDWLFELFKESIETKDVNKISIALDEWRKALDCFNNLEYIYHELTEPED